MLQTFLKAKLHHARVTAAELEYEGSCAIDSALLEAAGIAPFEQIHIYNVTNGARLITYAIEAPPGSATICVNGAAAHLASKGDRVIIAAYAAFTPEEARMHKPKVLILDEKNQIK
jgi:aspartate 1-decarboxylase